MTKDFDCVFIQNKFEDYAKQRNFAIENLPIRSEWVLFLDADEWLLDSLKQEITELVARSRGKWLLH